MLLKQTWLFIFISLLVIILFSSPSYALSEKLRSQDVEALINTLEKEYAYTWLKNINWNEMRNKYRPLVHTQKKDKEHYLLLTQILQELQDSHCKLINPKEKQRFNSGFKIKIVENKYLVTKVVKDSPAYQAGIRKGMELVQINKTTVPEILTEFKKHVMGSPQWVKEYTTDLLATLPGNYKKMYKTTYFTFQNKQKKEIKIRLKVPTKTPLIERSYWKWQTEPPFLESKWLKDQIGYIKINGFMFKKGKEASISSRFGTIVKSFAKKKAKALIIDLRDSNGGYGEEVCRMVSYFIPNEVILRQTCFPKGGNCIVKKRENLKLTYDYKTYPDLYAYDGPVVLITNSFCRSACDMFTAAFKMLNRAHIIGETTAGAGGTAKCQRLPSGVPFCYTNWPVVLADGNLVEGFGVKPDMFLKQTLKDFYEDKDTLLEAALNYINNLQVQQKNDPSF